MSDYQFQTPHDFENSKNELMKFSQNLPSRPSFNKLRTEGTSMIGSIFGTNHNVTGREVNSELIVPIQNEFNRIHKVQEDIVKEFGVVFNTFETLDKEYISGLNKNIQINRDLSVEAKSIAAKAFEAAGKAEEAQKNIQATVEALRVAMGKLSEFKADMQDIKNSAFIHLSNMKDEMNDINTKATKIEENLNNSQELLDKSQRLFRDVNDQKIEVTKLKLELELKK